MKFLSKIHPLVYISVVLILVGFGINKFISDDQVAPEKIKIVTTDDSNQMMLQVPLATTTDQRAQFTKEFKSWQDVLHLRPLYEKWIDKIGANGIIDSLNKINPECHDIAHDLGRIIYNKIGNIGDSLRTCDQACNSGCMHGVLMEYFHKDVKGDDDHVTLDNIKTKMSDICGVQNAIGDATMAKDYKQGDCAHGIGHAVMFLSDYNIPKAIKYCRLFGSDQLAYYCSTGAYMEYNTTHDQKDNTAHPDDVLYPCDNAEYPSACFRYKMAHVAPRFYQGGGTLNQLQQLCLNLKGKYQVGCFHGLGNGNFMFAASGRVTLKNLCDVGDHDDQYACTEGLMERMGRYVPEIAKKQCDTVTGWQRDLCLDDIHHELYDLNKPFELYIQ